MAGEDRNGFKAVLFGQKPSLEIISGCHGHHIITLLSENPSEIVCFHWFTF